jgi:hypothetical protein
MNPPDDWNALSAAWQAQPVDVDALRRAVQRRSWRMKLLMALDVACAVVGAVFAVHLFLGSAGFWPRVGSGIGLAALAAAVLINYRLRRGLWQAADSSVIALLNLQRQRCQNAVRMALWGPLFLPLGMLTGVLISPGWPAMAGQSSERIAAKLILVLLVVVVFCAISWLYVRRQRRRIAAIDALLEQLR